MSFGQGSITLTKNVSRTPVTPPPLTNFFSLPDGAFTDGIIPFTKNGAMTTAVFTKDNDKDNVAIAGGTDTSYLRLGRQNSFNNYRLRVRVKVGALGATPIVGFRGIWPGAPYSNFNNTQYSAHVNLLTGVMTTNNIGTLTNYNGVIAPTAVGDIVEFVVEADFEKQKRYLFNKVGNVNGETSLATRTKVVNADGDVYHSQHALILADGTYTILEFKIDIVNPLLPKFGILGDSMGGGVRISYADSIRGKWEAKLPYTTFGSSAGSMLLAGGFATIDQVLFVRPQYVLMMYYLDALQAGKTNPANPNYATFTAEYIRYVNILKAAGITPIFVTPQTWAVIDPAGTNCTFFKTFINATFPTDIKIDVLTSESFYDSTNFHYSGVTNGIIANKVIAALVAINQL